MKIYIGSAGCSWCGGLPGDAHESSCDSPYYAEARAAVAEEREACARVAEDMGYTIRTASSVAAFNQEMAARIRARGAGNGL